MTLQLLHKKTIGVQVLTYCIAKFITADSNRTRKIEIEEKDHFAGLIESR